MMNTFFAFLVALFHGIGAAFHFVAPFAGFGATVILAVIVILMSLDTLAPRLGIAKRIPAVTRWRFGYQKCGWDSLALLALMAFTLR